MTVWGGVFDEGAPGLDPLFERFNRSLPIDRRLLRQEAQASSAWADELAHINVLTPDEAAVIRQELSNIVAECEQDPTIIDAAQDEDIHSFIERLLTERLGDTGKKLHTGRSRNDLVATDLRLYLRQACDERLEDINALRRAFLELADRESATILPGYTHLQRAQPILLAHWCLAYNEMLARDASRFADARARLNECPLGAGALAGSGFDVDRHRLADALGFDRPSANSIDAVASRDAALELLAAASMLALTLSRCAEDLVLYASGEFAFVRMSERVATGSSIMPQKKNPDGAELVRALSGRALGAFTTLAVVLKGLPLAYNKDLQEDKRPVFDTMDTLALALHTLAVAVGTLEVDRARARSAAQLGYANATDLADLLARRGVPFREAHETVGNLVRHAAHLRLPLEELPDDAFVAHPKLTPEDKEAIALDAVLARRNTHGATSPTRVAEALAAARAELGL